MKDIEVIRYAEKRARDACYCFLRKWPGPLCEDCPWEHLCRELAEVFGKPRRKGAE